MIKNTYKEVKEEYQKGEHPEVASTSCVYKFLNNIVVIASHT